MNVRFTLLDDGSVHSKGDIVCEVESYADHGRKHAVEVSLDLLDEDYHRVLTNEFLGFEYVFTIGTDTRTGVLTEPPEPTFRHGEGGVRFHL